MKTLLVLGNGFDLNCKLNSKFSHFFEPKLAKTISNGENGIVLKDEFKSNIWYIILYFAFYGNKIPSYMYDGESLFPLIGKSDPLWMDVESYIKRIMTAKNKKIGEYINFIGEKSYIDVLNHADSNKGNYKHYLAKRNQYNELQMHFLRNDQIKKGKTMTEYLFYELQLFENDFKDYIAEEINKNRSSYKKDSQSLLKKLRDQNESLYILTFNYTTPKMMETDAINHIHGSIETKVIIGYDSSETNSNENPSLMLTKGWQKLFSGSRQTSLPIKESIECIKFYGHSLGAQDYSYFHSLFDCYDVYSRNVELVFCYSEYGNTPEENEIIRANYVSRVYSLLDKYVEESEKENKRRTFVSRLQLENRLRIKKI